jgi:hypothetical protein
MKTVIVDSKKYTFIGVTSIQVGGETPEVKHFVHCVDPKTNKVLVFEHDKCEIKSL